MSSSSQGSSYTQSVFLHSWNFWVLKICQNTLTIVGVLAGGSGYIHPGQKESQLVGDFIGWVVRSLRVKSNKTPDCGIPWRICLRTFLSLCSHFNLNIWYTSKKKMSIQVLALCIFDQEKNIIDSLRKRLTWMCLNWLIEKTDFWPKAWHIAQCLSSFFEPPPRIAPLWWIHFLQCWFPSANGLPACDDEYACWFIKECW